MGQAKSRYERPGGFWRRGMFKPTERQSKLEATAQQPPSPEGFAKMSLPVEPDRSSMKMQSPTLADESLTTANTTPASAPPCSIMQIDAILNTSINKTRDAGNKEQHSKYRQPPATLFPTMNGDNIVSNSDNKADDQHKAETTSAEQHPSNPHDPPMADKSDKPDQTSLLKRPRLKREFTPPHRIKVWSMDAWRMERAYAKAHVHITKTLNAVCRLPPLALFGALAHPPRPAATKNLVARC
jgi:hypothetical protein